MQFTRTNRFDEVLVKEAEVEVGRFSVYRLNPWSIGIYVEEEWRGQGMARRMMSFMLGEWRERGEYEPARHLYIDTDASEGFWNHIGMRENADVADDSVPQYGYEKCISVSELAAYLKF
jgi:GNAT superfamily N-acetyltransferase